MLDYSKERDTLTLVKKKQSQGLNSYEEIMLEKLISYLKRNQRFTPTLIKDILNIDRYFFMENKPVKKLKSPFVFSLGSVIVHSYLDEEGTLDIKKELMKTMMYIKNSLVPSFDKALIGNLYVGNKELANDMKGFLGRGSSFERQRKNNDAWYNHRSMSVFLVVDEDRSPKDRESDLIHEYAHKFHFNFIKDSSDILKLYEEAIRGEEHKKIPLPKIGDPLSNIVNYTSSPKAVVFDWSVKKAGEELYLTKIIYENGVIKAFLYQNKDRWYRLTLEELYSTIRKPSVYGSTNSEEFFAEMCTLITLNKVKDSQLYLANKFINIIKKNLI